MQNNLKNVQEYKITSKNKFLILSIYKALKAIKAVKKRGTILLRKNIISVLLRILRKIYFLRNSLRTNIKRIRRLGIFIAAKKGC